MKFSLVAAASSVFTIVNALAASPAPTAPDQSQVYINGIKYGGSGCKQGTADIFLSEDKKSFTVLLDDFIAAAGPNYPAPYKDRKNCQINIDLHIPQGWQYSIFSADYRGYVNIEKDVKATQATHYYFTGTQGTAHTKKEVWGPLEQSYALTDFVPFQSVVWSQCNYNAALNINSEVRIDASKRKGSNGIITTDSVDGRVKFIIGFQWRKC